MSLSNVNGIGVISGKLMLPIYGRWFADLTLDADAAPSGTALVSVGGSEWVGTFKVSEAWQGRTMVRIVGGSGGIDVLLPGRGYRNIEARSVVDDVIRESSEVLSDDSDADRLGQLVGSFVRFYGTGGYTLEAVGAQIGCTWRHLADGTIWMGVDEWADGADDYEVMEYDAVNGRLMVPFDGPPKIVVGTTIEQGRVVGVAHDLAGLRTEAYLE